MRYPAGEWQWMRLRFKPADGERFARVEIVAENGTCDFTVTRLECGPPSPRPLSPTWACDSVSGIDPLPHYTEPEEEVIPPLTEEIRRIVRERKPAKARVEVIDGRPRFTLDGEPFVPAFYNGCWFNPRLSQYGDFRRASPYFPVVGFLGVRIRHQNYDHQRQHEIWRRVNAHTDRFQRLGIPLFLLNPASKPIAFPMIQKGSSSSAKAPRYTAARARSLPKRASDNWRWTDRNEIAADSSASDRTAPEACRPDRTAASAPFAWIRFLQETGSCPCW